MNNTEPVEPQNRRNPGRMTTKQGLLVHGLANGLSVAEAGRMANYADRHNAHEQYRALRERFLVDLEDVGLTTRDVALKLQAKMDAKKTELFAHKGVVTDSVELEDHATQLVATQAVARLMGLGSEESGPSIGTVNITWHGSAPSWANPASPVAPDANVLLASTVESTANSSDTEITPGISTLEGTGNGPGAPTHTHSYQSAEKCSSGIAKSTLDSRIKKKRRPRLPVYHGGDK